jgi:Holliday junction resolvase-like predicted endonuclease
MAKLYGNARGYGFWMERVAACASAVWSLFGVAVLWLLFAVNRRHLLDPLSLLIIAVMYGPILFIIYRQYRKEEGNRLAFFHGNRGEELVRDELSKLPDGYTIFGDVVVSSGRGNVDFIVVGPTAVCTVEVKSNWGGITYTDGQLTCNDRSFNGKSILKQAKAEALAVQYYLREKLGTSIAVQPIVAFSGNVHIKFGKKPIEDVVVIQKRWLREVIMEQPISGSPELMRRVGDALTVLVQGNRK